MGQEIVYCDDCRSRLTGQDFEKGGALRVGHRTFCSPCAPKTPAAPLRPPSNSGAPRVRPVPAPRRTSRPLALWISLALAALALIVLVAVASNPGRNAPPRAEQAAP